MSEFISHAFPPVFDEHSRVLILGTMPSPKSREIGFYYSHPQNRFWRTIAEVLGEPLPVSVGEKTELLRKHKIAMWDVLSSCKITGADDSSIKDSIPNDFSELFKTANIQAVFTTGKKATELFKKHCAGKYGFSPIYLPSTSGANCRVRQAELVEAYRVVLKYME